MAIQGPGEQPHRDEYFVRRLEAFGDVVIGFSLALLALSLFVPNHAAQLVAHAEWFVAYVWTFAFVCTMWGQHYWTFRHVFVPNRISLLLNYAKLGLIVLLIFFVQVLLRAFEMGNAHDVVVGNELYWGCLAAYWAVTALTAGRGHARANQAAGAGHRAPLRSATLADRIVVPLCSRELRSARRAIPASTSGTTIAIRQSRSTQRRSTSGASGSPARMPAASSSAVTAQWRQHPSRARCPRRRRARRPSQMPATTPARRKSTAR